MSEYHRIEFIHTLTQHLLPKIGTGINDKRGIVVFDQYGSTQAFVAVVERLAYFTGACDDRNTLRSTGAEKGYFHASSASGGVGFGEITTGAVISW